MPSPNAILVALYHMLRKQTPYQDMGVDHGARRQQRTVATQLIKRLERLGYAVALQPRAG